MREYEKIEVLEQKGFLMKSIYYIFMFMCFVSCKAMQNDSWQHDLKNLQIEIAQIQEKLQPLLESHNFFKQDNPNQQIVDIGLQLLRAAVQKSYALRNEQAGFMYKRSDYADSRSSYSSRASYESKS